MSNLPVRQNVLTERLRAAMLEGHNQRYIEEALATPLKLELLHELGNTAYLSMDGADLSMFSELRDGLRLIRDGLNGHGVGLEVSGTVFKGGVSDTGRFVTVVVSAEEMLKSEEEGVIIGALLLRINSGDRPLPLGLIRHALAGVSEHFSKR